MLNIVRRSEIIGWMAIDSATAAHLGQIEEVWLDASGRIAYLSNNGSYLPLEQVASVGMGAVTLYHARRVDAPVLLHPIHQLMVCSLAGESLGGVADILFDWQTGEVAAYILSGEIAAPFGGRAVLSPEDVEVMSAETIVIRDDATDRLKSEPDGLQGFLSEKSQQVKHLVHLIGDRVHSLLSPDDKPEVVRVKIQDVSHELATSGESDQDALHEATDFLHQQWEHLHHSIHRAGSRAKAALDATWKQLTGKR
jgi:uncharacterized protein YrrD